MLLGGFEQLLRFFELLGLKCRFELFEIGFKALRQGPLLLDALRQIALPSEGDGYVWVACEHAQVQGLRGHFIDAGVPKQHLHVASYWKHGAAEHHEHHDA